ncbi:polymerase [Nibricoccus aquaticus]|uniref:Polymerase n=1 Tax=Nibricoccus aquaticus TaxID=2576891 RepID=A0A290Q2H2_9BACT|nr:O-antigen ligase family protein [Nibricoccus aquaticus]ATC62507.1 polymerase [Nibricoccus aquaticus]
MEPSAKIPQSPAPPSVGSRLGSRKKSTRLHPLEIAFLALISAHLVFLPWALGTMHVWSQLVSFSLAFAGFALALIPRTHTEEFSDDGRRYRYIPSRRLLAFPGFWLGLAVLFYAFVQALNPAWNYASSSGDWWMEEKAYIAWLPSGATAPFADSNPWRSLLVWSSAWMLACSLWIGLTRRASIRSLLVILTINATALALVGILQHVAGNGKILWLITPSTHYSVATFLYKNHAGAFFNLMLAASAATATWYYRRSERRLERTSPAPLFTLCAVALSLIVALSFSRAATVLMIGFVLLSLVLGAIYMLRSARRPNLLLVSLLTVSLTILAFVSARQLRLEQAAEKFQQLFTTDRVQSFEFRQLSAQATWDMASERLATGWGAGCYRFLFPLFQQNYPQIYQPAPNADRSFLFEHAHNDYLEFLAELGLIGCAPLVILLLLLATKLIRGRLWQNPPLLFLALGLLILLAHCWIDFHLHCPAILLTACALAAIAGRWSELESRRRSP